MNLFYCKKQSEHYEVSDTPSTSRERRNCYKRQETFNSLMAEK